ncbi:phage-related hypothetical protein [Bordetella parapertussis Bpp5]|uniref:Uncharacterized protein n=2 Tax=Bordetella TaxID=517 RepID=K0MHU6_BORPB|nr:hypothetical protein B7P10_15100 [Bordetella bronchiseptica]RFT69648.1 hypothetical protein DX898_21050 [Bordetella bronchiseptica]CCJ49420.1 phage-related hypothetical protein [Bordetella parapertussis Bpp5]CCJ51932.1 phage-related hypothetical protein [Bordetella bronchiseptica 253]
MTWARRSDRGDPAKVLERRQEPPPVRSCAGCAHIRLVKSEFDGRRILTCSHGMQVGQRCRLFEERRSE